MLQLMSVGKISFQPALPSIHQECILPRASQSILAWPCCQRSENKSCYDSWSAAGPQNLSSSFNMFSFIISRTWHVRKYAAVAPNVHLGWTFFGKCQQGVQILQLTMTLWCWNCKASTKPLESNRAWLIGQTNSALSSTINSSWRLMD